MPGSERQSVSVLFVCMGNICRSPTGQGVFEDLLARKGADWPVEVDSAGTHAYHVGEQPDPRSRAAAAARGIDLSGQRARKVADTDFERFDFVVAMDRLNLATLLDRCPEEYAERLQLFRAFGDSHDDPDVPDPYYGGDAGFEHVLDLCERASEGLLDAVEERLRSRGLLP